MIILKNHNVISHVHLLLTLLSHEYFARFYCVLQFTNEKTVISPHGHYLVPSDIKFGRKEINKFDRCLGILIYSSKNPRETFEMFEKFIQMHSRNDFNERKYIIRFNAMQQNEFESFFDSESLKFVADVLIVKEINDEFFELYTHQYVGSEGNRPYLLNSWSSSMGFHVNSTLFPDKLSNQFGKRLIVGGDKYLPITDPDHLKGPETRLIIEYATQHNLTLIFDKRFKNLGELRPNWTGTGYMGMLLQDLIDVVSYAVYIQIDRKDFGDFTFPNCEIRVTCLVPKPRLNNQWMIIKIFTFDVWLLIAFSILLVMIIFKIFRLFYVISSNNEHQEQPFQYLIAYRIFIGQSSTLQIHTQIERFLISILLACVILIQTFFNSKLFSFITVPNYVDDINTLEDLAKSDIKWYSKFDDKGKIIQHEQKELMISLFHKFRHVTSDDLTTIEDSSYAYAIDESFTSHYFAIDDYFTIENLQVFKVMKEYIIGHQYTAFFLRRNSILLNGINKLCHRTLEHGLIKYWELDSLSDGMERKIQAYLAMSGKIENPLIKLDVTLLIGSFLIWFIGLGIATVVFLLEFSLDRASTASKP